MNYEEIAVQFGFTANRVSTIHDALGEAATVDDVRSVAQIVLEQGASITAAVAQFRGEAVEAPKQSKQRRKTASKRTEAPKSVESNGLKSLSSGLTPNLAGDIKDEAVETRIQAELYFNHCFAEALTIPGEEIDDPRLLESREMVRSVLSGAVASSPFDRFPTVDMRVLLSGTTTTLQLEAAQD